MDTGPPGGAVPELRAVPYSTGAVQWSAMPHRIVWHGIRALSARTPTSFPRLPFSRTARQPVPRFA